MSDFVYTVSPYYDDIASIKEPDESGDWILEDTHVARNGAGRFELVAIWKKKNKPGDIYE